MASACEPIAARRRAARGRRRSPRCSSDSSSSLPAPEQGVLPGRARYDADASTKLIGKIERADRRSSQKLADHARRTSPRDAQTFLDAMQRRARRRHVGGRQPEDRGRGGQREPPRRPTAASSTSRTRTASAGIVAVRRCALSSCSSRRARWTRARSRRRDHGAMHRHRERRRALLTKDARRRAAKGDVERSRLLGDACHRPSSFRAESRSSATTVERCSVIDGVVGHRRRDGRRAPASTYTARDVRGRRPLQASASALVPRSTVVNPVLTACEYDGAYIRARRRSAVDGPSGLRRDRAVVIDAIGVMSRRSQPSDPARIDAELGTVDRHRARRRRGGGRTRVPDASVPANAARTPVPERPHATSGVMWSRRRSRLAATSPIAGSSGCCSVGARHRRRRRGGSRGRRLQPGLDRSYRVVDVERQLALAQRIAVPHPKTLVVLAGRRSVDRHAAPRRRRPRALAPIRRSSRGDTCHAYANQAARRTSTPAAIQVEPSAAAAVRGACRPWRPC